EFMENAGGGKGEKEKYDFVLNEALKILVDFADIHPGIKVIDTASKDSVPSVKREDVPEKVQAEILRLIKNLSHKDGKIRKSAEIKLKEIGPDAIPFLEDHKDSDDPEVRITIKKLLEH
ncbi:hypothetical protein ACFLS1_04160, partial [Verrucomicrobiota bacterium]